MPITRVLSGCGRRVQPDPHLGLLFLQPHAPLQRVQVSSEANQPAGCCTPHHNTTIQYHDKVSRGGVLLRMHRDVFCFGFFSFLFFSLLFMSRGHVVLLAQRPVLKPRRCVSPQCGGVLGGHGRADGQWKRGHWKDPERKGKHHYISEMWVTVMSEINATRPPVCGGAFTCKAKTQPHLTESLQVTQAHLYLDHHWCNCNQVKHQGTKQPEHNIEHSFVFKHAHGFLSYTTCQISASLCKCTFTLSWHLWVGQQCMKRPTECLSNRVNK